MAAWPSWAPGGSVAQCAGSLFRIKVWCLINYLFHMFKKKIAVLRRSISLNISVFITNRFQHTNVWLFVVTLGVQVEAWPGPGNSRCGCHRGHGLALAPWWVMARWMRRVVVCSASVEYYWIIFNAFTCSYLNIISSYIYIYIVALQYILDACCVVLMCAILLTNDGSFDANPPLRSLRPDCSFLGPQWQFRIDDVRRCPIPWFQQRFHKRIMLCKTKEHTAFEATPPHREAASKWSTTGRSCCEGRACKLKQPMMWVCLEMGHTGIPI